MQTSSHLRLSHILSASYLTHVPLLCRSAFLFGCIEPDYNFTTYLRGCLRTGTPQGHNFPLSCPVMEKLCCSLSNGLTHALDFYRLGKLIHYVEDAFTYPHNTHFTGNLSDHIRYEQALDLYLASASFPALPACSFQQDPMDCILTWHQRYLAASPGMETDSFYAFSAVSRLLLLFLPDQQGEPIFHFSEESAPALSYHR